jgi:hypothetical protein
VTQWGAYVTARLDELGRGEGDYEGFRRPAGAVVGRAREVAAQTFRDTTPTPSVVPDEDGNVLFVWHKNRIDAEITVGAASVDVWVHDRESGEIWSGLLGDHSGCCVQRLLDRLSAG